MAPGKRPFLWMLGCMNTASWLMANGVMTRHAGRANPTVSALRIVSARSGNRLTGGDGASLQGSLSLQQSRVRIIKPAEESMRREVGEIFFCQLAQGAD